MKFFVTKRYMTKEIKTLIGKTFEGRAYQKGKQNLCGLDHIKGEIYDLKGNNNLGLVSFKIRIKSGEEYYRLLTEAGVIHAMLPNGSESLLAKIY